MPKKSIDFSAYAKFIKSEGNADYALRLRFMYQAKKSSAVHQNIETIIILPNTWSRSVNKGQITNS